MKRQQWMVDEENLRYLGGNSMICAMCSIEYIKIINKVKEKQKRKLFPVATNNLSE